MEKFQMKLGENDLIIETGKVARLASGAVTVKYGDTIVLVSVVMSKEPREGMDFFPLTVDYRERAYAAGKIPGGFFKREGRPAEREILSARLIDRPIRALFSDDFRNEIQIMVTVLSADQENEPDVLALIGASTALVISEIPFPHPLGAVRMGKIGEKYLVNPTTKELEESDFNLVIAGTKEAVMMLEGGAKEAKNEDVLGAIKEAHNFIKEIIALQEDLARTWGKEKREIKSLQIEEEVESKVREFASSFLEEACQIPEKQEREKKVGEVFSRVWERFGEEFAEKEKQVKAVLEKMEKEIVRKNILEKGRRVDGRGLDEIRPIKCEVGILPRTHGSGLFTRGQTQSLTVTTLGTSIDEQRIDDITGESSKAFMLHYNFPPYSVGEVRPNRGPGRREIGHGALAEKALCPLMPKGEDFPYTVRVVSDILESNGSSSMATVCSAALSLMDAGVSLKSPVAGIAIGLIKEKEKAVILTDILGLEDWCGDMDLKMAGTASGITALQMDLKTSEMTQDILEKAFAQAEKARLVILEKMKETISEPRPHLSQYAPRIATVQVPVSKIGGIIGPGGKTIRAIIEETKAEIDINDDGRVSIYSPDEKAVEKAVARVKALIEEAEVGRIYLGKVVRIMAFGAFVEILPGKDGLVHISELEEKRVNKVEDVVKEGDEVLVKVINVDEQGRIKLSRKAALKGKETDKRAEKRDSGARPKSRY